MTRPIARPDRLTFVTWLVAALAAVDFSMKPERAWTWLVAVALMACMRLVVGGLSRSRRPQAQRALRDAGALGGLFVAAALAVAILKGLGLEHGWIAERAFGLVTGLVLLVLGNAIPKSSVPPTGSTCVQGTYATRRFAGWMFAGAGAIGLAAWLFAPVDQAGVIATVTCFSALALVVIRCIANPSTEAID